MICVMIIFRFSFPWLIVRASTIRSEQLIGLIMSHATRKWYRESDRQGDW